MDDEPLEHPRGPGRPLAGSRAATLTKPGARQVFPRMNVSCSGFRSGLDAGHGVTGIRDGLGDQIFVNGLV